MRPPKTAVNSSQFVPVQPISRCVNTFRCSLNRATIWQSFMASPIPDSQPEIIMLVTTTTSQATLQIQRFDLKETIAGRFRETGLTWDAWLAPDALLTKNFRRSSRFLTSRASRHTHGQDNLRVDSVSITIHFFSREHLTNHFGSLLHP